MLFVTDKNVVFYEDGKYSGKQKRVKRKKILYKHKSKNNNHKMKISHYGRAQTSAPVPFFEIEYLYLKRITLCDKLLAKRYIHFL